MPIQPGIYITFFDEGEPVDRELPPVGPLVHVVARHKQLVAERKAIQQPDDVAGIDRWLEAELEYQRAIGEEPGGTRRAHMRVNAPEGVFLRFAAFGDPHERAPVGELGPFAVVFVGRRSIEADGTVLATRQISDLAPWELTSDAGDEVAGVHKPDIAFRTIGVAYHPSIGPAPQRARLKIVEPPRPAPVAPPAPPAPSPVHEPPPTPPEPEPTYAPPPPAADGTALTAADQKLIERIDRERAADVLRARLQDEERRRLGVDEDREAASTWSMRYRPPGTAESAEESRGFAISVGPLLWRLRFAFIGLLLVGVGFYGFTIARTGFAPGPQSQAKTVGVAERISGPRWEYVVNGVQRVQAAGTAKPRGVFIVVRIGITNRGAEGAQTSPGDFGLVDSAGTQYSPESLRSDVYSSPRNSTPYNWPQAFPSGRTLTTQIIFDVDPSAKGLQLVINEVPNTRVRID